MVVAVADVVVAAVAFAVAVEETRLNSFLYLKQRVMKMKKMKIVQLGYSLEDQNQVKNPMNLKF